MNIQMPGIAIRTADDFLRWNEGREGKREFVDGRIIEMMTGVTRNHWRVVSRFGRLLGERLDDTIYDFGAADFGVRTERGVRYPDFLVEETCGGPKDLAAEAPLLIAEILSPSSIATDFGTKAADYTAVPSLQHYLVLAQDEPRVWIWTREDGAFAEPAMLAGPEAALTLAAFDVTLSLADLYRGIA